MSIECKTYATQGAARTGITNAEKSWTPPTYENVGGGRHADHATLPPQKLSEPVQMVNGRWAVIADHHGMKGETITDADLKRDPPPVIEAAPKGGK